MKIAICGGHLAPALAVMEELKEQKPLTSFIYFGRKNYLEYKALQGWDNVIFINQHSGRWQRFITLYNLITPLKVTLGFFQSLYYLYKFNPDVVVSFGGYLSVPVVIAAWLLNIPILSHEQTSSAGMASKINSFFSSVICVSWPESLLYFKADKTILTGNPLRKSVITPKLNSKFLELEKLKSPIIFITGGNQGAQVINENIKEILPELLKKYILIHQTGNIAKYQISLPQALQKNYFLFEHIDPDDVGVIYKISSLVICRGGANTVSELLYLKKKAILIPLPFAQNNEQANNAKRLSELGLAIVLRQNELNPQKLIESIEEIFKRKIEITQKGENNAAKAIVIEIFNLYEKKKNRH